MYYTFIYALQQEKTASMVIEDMELFYKVAEDLLNQGVPNKKLDQFTLYNLEDLIAKVRKLREKAVLGQKQALYALKEAMGVEPSFPIFPGESELPVMGGDVTMDRVVELALALRPELVQAASAVDVYRLEICAQARIRHRSVHPTFAQGSDLHARILPTPIRNGEYRPGAVPPEMPNVLVGRVEDRVARATELSLRQDAVYEKAYGLIRLEAVNAFLNWQAAAQRADESKKRFDRSRKVVEEALKAAPTKQDPELVVRTEALAGETQAEYVDAVFKLIESLIHLERVTAGGVRPSFPGR
jgi:outer membrane protein TolC